MCQKCMWIINFLSPWRKFVCVCVYARAHERTALYFIQVDSKFMLPAPSALESYCKKVKWKAAVFIIRFRYTATASHSHLWMVMQKRWCFMQTNPAETHQQKLEQWKNKTGFGALYIQTTAGSYPHTPFYVSYKKKLGVPSVKPLTVVMRIFAGVFGFVLLSYRYLTDRAMCIIF